MALRKRSRKSERKSNKTAKKRHVHRGGATCPNCNGAGATFRQIPCSSCDGQGHFLEILTDFRGKPRKVWHNCQVCGGNGTATIEVPCYTCGGTGQVPDPPPQGKRRY